MNRLATVASDAIRTSGEVKRVASRQLGGLVADVAGRLTECIRGGGRAYVIGNGGSAADAQHFAAEFTGRFRNDREPLPVVALTTDTSALTAIANDYGVAQMFARQVTALGRRGDMLIALSTSGDSENVLAACLAARAQGMVIVGVTGARGGRLRELCDLMLRVPSSITSQVQECTMTLLHALCEVTEHLLEIGGSVDLASAEVILGIDHLAPLGERWRAQGLVVVSTNGCFDVLHGGHLASLHSAAELGDILVVLVNSDRSVRRLKGARRPFQSETDRAALVGALKPVDYVAIFEEDTPTAALSLLKPSIHCKGEEYRLGPRPMAEEQAVIANGGRIEFLPRVPGVSSTLLIGAVDGS